MFHIICYRFGMQRALHLNFTFVSGMECDRAPWRMHAPRHNLHDELEGIDIISHYWKLMSPSSIVFSLFLVGSVFLVRVEFLHFNGEVK